MKCLKCGARMFRDIDNYRAVKTAIFWCLCCGLEGTADELPIKVAAINRRMFGSKN